MNPAAKVLIAAGVVLIAAGIFWQIGGRILPLGRLPGDIRVERENVKFYFPIVTCIILSIALSLLMAVLNRFFGGRR